MFEFDPNNLQKIKLVVHLVQALFVVVSWVLAILVFRDATSIDGRVGWFFGLCFIEIPAIIFLTMSPRFPRTRKLAHPLALAIVDSIFCVLSLSAFAALANFNTSGKAGGGLAVSKATVGMGVFVWFFWVATTAISLYGLMYYRREGFLPGASRVPQGANMIDPDKDAFSTAPHDDEYAPVHHVDDHDEEASYGGGSQFQSYSGRYVGPSAHDEPTEYLGHEEPTTYTGYSAGGSQGGRTPSPTGPAQFPTGNYDNLRIIGDN